MRATIHPGENIGDWLSGPVSRHTLGFLDRTGLLVASRSDVRSWHSTHTEQASPGTSRELLEAILERVLTIDEDMATAALADFQINEQQGDLEDTLNSEDYEARVAWRQASPFLEGEGTSGAFSRLFGHLLPISLDWQIVDQFLVEQLMRREPVWNFLAGHVESFPKEVEIHSRSPHKYELRTSIEATESLQELESVFLAHGKKLTIRSYFSTADNRVAFPHPRLQKIRFPKRDLISSLDNGLNSLVLDGPTVFGQATVQDWSKAQEILKLMRVRTLTKF